MSHTDHHADATPTQAAPVDPVELANAEAMWTGFTKFATYSVVAIAIILSLMAFFLL